MQRCAAVDLLENIKHKNIYLSKTGYLESSFDDRSNRNIHLFRGSVEITRSNQSSIKEGKRPFNPNI